jgi:methyl-accepting chemotaxis protein
MKSISHKLILTVLVIVSITNSIFLFVAGSISKKELSDVINEEMKCKADLVASQIRAINEQEFRLLRSLSRLPEIIDDNIDMHEKWRMMNSIAKSDKEYLGMAIYNEKGVGWTTTEKWKDLSDREYLAQSIKTQKPYIMKPNWSPINGNVSTFYAQPYFDGYKMKGVLVSVLDGLNLSYVVSSIKVGKESHPVIVEMHSGAIVASSDLTDVQEQRSIRDGASPEFLKIIDQVCGGRNDQVVYTDSVTKQKLACVYRPVEGSCDWAVILTVPVDDFFGGLNFMIRILVIVFVLSTLITILFIGFVIVRSMRPLQKLKSNINDIAMGHADLTQRITVTTKDEIGDVVAGFNSFTEKLHSIVKDIKNSEGELSTAGHNLQEGTQLTSQSISEILENIRNVDGQILKQTENVNQTASAVNEIASNITSLERMVENQASEVQHASASVEQMIKSIEQVDQTVSSLAESFTSLLSNVEAGSQKQLLVNQRVVDIEDQSKMLQVANQAISNIASQTNLLAMNAAIEAAHAGAAGQGFAVVADEIRKLSETSSMQSKSIREQLGKIRKSIENVVNASTMSKESFDTVFQEIKRTDTLVQQIKSAMDEQTLGSNEISEALSTMNNSTADVRASAKEMANGNKIILGSVKELQDSTVSMRDSMEEMASGAKKIDSMGNSLSQVSSSIESSINNIGNQINQFKV